MPCAARHVPEPRRRAAHDDAEVAEQRAGEPHGHRAGAHEEAHGQEHGGEVHAERHARQGHVAEQQRGDGAQPVAQRREQARQPHGAEQLLAGGAAGVARDERLRGRLADGVLQLGVLDEVPAQQGRAHEAQHHARQRHGQHLEPVDLGGVPEHPGAGDGESQPARHHGAGRHDRVRDVRLVQVRLPCPRAFRKNSEMMAAKMMGQGSAPILRAVYADAAVMIAQPTHPMSDAAQRQLPLQGLHVLLLFVYPLPLASGSRVTDETGTV